MKRVGTENVKKPVIEADRMAVAPDVLAMAYYMNAFRGRRLSLRTFVGWVGYNLRLEKRFVCFV